MRRTALLATVCVFLLISCSEEEKEIELVSAESVEVGKSLPLSVYLTLPGHEGPVNLEWEVSGGEIQRTRVENEVNFIAPPIEGAVEIRVSAGSGDDGVSLVKTLTVVGSGALKSTAAILLEVDTNTLKGVYVDENAPRENFTPPLKVKGTFHYNEASGQASAGGNWTNYLLYDDGTHGDREENDGLWSLAMDFERSDEKVNFAFDDGSDYRVQWESGLTWRLKTAWTALDDFPNDNENPAFVPDGDKVLSWDQSMADEGNIYQR